MERLDDLTQQFRIVLTGRTPLIDYLIPSLAYLAANQLWGVEEAFLTAAFTGLGLVLWRVVTGQSVTHSLLGVIFGLILAGISYLGRFPELVVYQDILSSLIIIVALMLSILFDRPLVAWTSRLVRDWPAAWYRHPRVQPAYLEVTWLWLGFSLVKLVFQLMLLVNSISSTDLIIRVLLGWPFMVVLLVTSYLYGIWRLQQLGGPSVNEFQEKAPPPWSGQQSGF